jgi:hypothetical protein
MKRHFWFLALLLASVASAQEATTQPVEADIAKGRVVERATEELVGELSSTAGGAAAAADDAGQPRPADRTKRVEIERAVEEVMRDLAPAGAGSRPTAPAAASGDNPAVEPGKVQWHQDVSAAIAAAKDSGKPVLVFHLLGQLDQRFT